MKNIEVAILDQHVNPEQLLTFLARLTQRGHKITTMEDLLTLYQQGTDNKELIQNMANLPHGAIKRFTPITVAIVGASRRFLGQARTHQVGMNYVSASLQYSDYSGSAQFVVPYAITQKDFEATIDNEYTYEARYLDSCFSSLKTYEYLVANGVDNDTAGYAMPQGMRNILIMQGNHQSWDYFVRLRSCNRNTNETRYVTTLIWDTLQKSNYGEELFSMMGPDCLYGKCREGKFCCGKPFSPINGLGRPEQILKYDWPLLNTK